MAEAPTRAPGKRPAWRLPLQLLVSVAVLALLIRDAEWERVRSALAGASLGWLALATLVKAGGLTLHELRLWFALRSYARRPVWAVVAIGYVSGLLNTVLPIRGGDLVAIALLRRELDVPTPSAVAAIGLTSFLEAAVFAVFLLGVSLLGASRWEELLGTAMARQATGSLTLITVGAVFGSVLLVLVARRLRRTDEGPRGPGAVELVRSTLVQAGEGLTSWGLLGANVGLAAVQVALVVFSFWAILPALGLELELSLLAVCGVIGVGAFAAVLLPPTFGAGTAATSIFVLGFFGVNEAEALAFTALSWIANTLPPLICGIVPLLRRIGRIGELLRPGGATGG